MTFGDRVMLGRAGQGGGSASAPTLSLVALPCLGWTAVLRPVVLCPPNPMAKLKVHLVYNLLSNTGPDGMLAPYSGDCVTL